MFCQKCGASMPDDSRFCRMCGVSLVPVEVGAPPVNGGSQAELPAVAAARSTPREPALLWSGGRPHDLPPVPPQQHSGERRRRRHHQRWYQKLAAAVSGYLSDILRIVALLVAAGLLMMMLRG